jgi:DNA-binding beta-propeller fold protein YncE
MKRRRSIIQFALKNAGLILVLVVLKACEKDPLDVKGAGLDFSRGVFIINEGNFLAGNASISFYDPGLDTVHNQVFYRANQSPLGDVANSMTIWNGMAYVPVNNSGRIYIMDPVSMEYQGKITGLTSPRYISVIHQDKAYVSDLVDKRINMVDPTAYKSLDSSGISGHIDLKKYSTEQILLSGTVAFMACWSYGDMVFVVDTETDSLVDSIQVGKQPNSMVMDKNGDIWVLCDGGYTGSPYGQEKASLWYINGVSHNGMRKMEFGNLMDSPVDLAINASGDTLFYLNGDVCRTGIGNVEPGIFIEGNGKQFYGLGIDPGDNTVYVADAVDYQQNGWVYAYTTTGVLLDSFRVGINPGFFCFFDRDK